MTVLLNNICALGVLLMMFGGVFCMVDNFVSRHDLRWLGDFGALLFLFGATLFCAVGLWELHSALVGLLA